MTKLTRYRYETVPLSLAEAKENRCFDILRLQEKLQAVQDELKELLASPLPTGWTKQISVEPGDAGYEEAPEAFHGVNYQGDFRFKQL